MFDDLVDCNHFIVQIGAVSVFNFAVLQAAVTDRNTVRNTDQFPFGEHHAGAVAAVVDDNVDTGFLELVVEVVCCFADGFALVVTDRADNERTGSR